MGALIQTKGTQRLARFFNNQRFDAGSIPRTRNVQNLISGTGTSLSSAFAAAFDSTPLLTISDNFIAQYATANATWVPRGLDVLYPAATLVAAQAAVGNQIIFNNPNPGWPASIAVGGGVPIISASNLDRPLGIPKGATVTAIALATPAAGQTTVTFSCAAVTAAQNDRISFCSPKHQNLVRRWRHFLAHDLQPSNHSLIQSAVLSALTDTSVASATFQTIEHYDQRVLTNTEFQTTNADDDNLSTATKYIQVALITPRTTAPDALDDQ
jgi:hypothetical protein